MEILWNCVTTKSEKWSYQNEIRMLAFNKLSQPELEIHNKDVRPHACTYRNQISSVI